MKQPAGKSSSSAGPAKTLSRGLRILEEACRRPEGITQSEMARHMGVNRSTALRFLSTLEAEGYLARAESGRYRPTVKVAELARAVIDSLDIKKYARGQLAGLTEQTGFSSHLAVISGRQIIYIDGEQATGMVKVNADIGENAPVHCSATGKALAAYMEPGRREAVFAAYLAGGASFRVYTDRTIACPARLEEELSLIRARGYAIDDEEYESGVRCLAAPIFEPEGGVAAAIGISGTTTRLSAGKIAELSLPVCTAADIISRAAGCSDSYRFRLANKESKEVKKDES